MGWPKKNQEAKLYYERKAKTYLLVFLNHESMFSNLDAVGEVYINNDPEQPALAGTTVSPAYISDNWLPRVQWDELPEVWQKSFKEWFNGKPENIRGFWRVENFHPTN